MPPKKKPAPSPHRPTPTMGIAMLLTVVVVAVIGLVLVWKTIPHASTTPVAPPPANADNAAREACTAAGGHWTDCGSPCHGKNRDACAQVCEAQCLCGGIAGWQCPKDLTCTDYEPSPTTPDALGVCRKVEASEASVDSVRERPAGAICDDTNSICVDEGYQNMLLTSPFSVTGTAVAFEAQFSWRLEDANGEKIEEGSAYGASTPEAPIPPFTIRAFILQIPKTATGTLVLFESSAKDGSPIHVLKIPVKLPSETQKLTTLGVNEEGGVPDPYPEVFQVVATKLPIEASIRLFLKRASENQLTDALKSLSLKNGLLTLIFTTEAEKFAQEPGNMNFKTDIELTAKQFSSVKKVIIQFEGKTPEESLQP